MKLQDLTVEEQREVAQKLLGKKYGNMAEVHAELSEKYGVSTAVLYRWAKKLKENRVIDFETSSFIKSRSTLLDADGMVKLQWVKEDREVADRLASIAAAVQEIVSTVVPVEPIERVAVNTVDDVANLYLCNDLHVVALMDKSETGDRNWDRKVAIQTIKASIDYLVDNSPATKVAFIADLGDLLEIDNFKNATPKSGNILDVDGRYSKILAIALEAMTYMIEKALTKHETVLFLNINGNHDIATGHAVRAYVQAWFRNNDRVEVDEKATEIKYVQFGSTMLGFAHGDGLSMRDAGEVMACDNEGVFSQTVNRYFHFGHNHKDSVYDGRLCRSESHRNLSPLNNWAAHKGYRRQAGTMKCISYHKDFGEISRTTFNVNMMEV